MIAINFRKHPEAAALQMPLRFGPPVWNHGRPGSRVLRAIRAARGAAFKAAGLIRYPEAARTPQWWLDGRQRARKLAQWVKQACMSLFNV